MKECVIVTSNIYLMNLSHLKSLFLEKTKKVKKFPELIDNPDVPVEIK